MNLIISLKRHSNTYMFVAMRTMSSTHVTMATIAMHMNFKKKRGEKINLNSYPMWDSSNSSIL